MEETRGRYAYAYDSSGGLMSALGARGYPSAALVDPSGTVVWTGHPASLEGETISKYLPGAFKKPVWEWPKSTKSLVKLLKSKQFAKSLEKLDRLAGTDDSIADIRSSVETMIARRMSSLEKAYTEGDFMGALDLADRARKDMKGIDVHFNRAEELKSLIKKDKEAKRVMKLQGKLLDLRDERINTRKDVLELIDLASELRDEGDGTFAAKQAIAFIEELREMIS